MSSYKVVTYNWVNGYLERGVTYDGHATPTDALSNFAEYVEGHKELGNLAEAHCLDEDTGVSQWVLRVN